MIWTINKITIQIIRECYIGDEACEKAFEGSLIISHFAHEFSKRHNLCKTTQNESSSMSLGDLGVQVLPEKRRKEKNKEE